MARRARNEDEGDGQLRYSVRHNDGGLAKIGWARSATKHRISKDRTRFVVEQAACCFEQDSNDQNPRLWLLGDDPGGVALEVLGVEEDSRILVVIHAMRLRVRHRDAYEEAERWREGRDIR